MEYDGLLVRCRVCIDIRLVYDTEIPTCSIMTKRLVGLMFVGLLIRQYIVISAAIEIWALGLEHDIP